jgi:Ulp1 family protease
MVSSPFIAIFDSLGKTCYQTVFKTLRNYISEAASDKLGITNLDTKQILGRYAKVNRVFIE